MSATAGLVIRGMLVTALLAVAGCRRDERAPTGTTGSTASTASTASAPARAPATNATDDDGWAASDALKAKLASDVPADMRDTFASRTMRLAAIDAPYLAKSEIYRATRTFRVGEEMVRHPSTWLLARVPGRGFHALATRADWGWLRTEDGLRLDSEPRRVGYVRAFVESVGRTERRYDWIVDKVEDLQLFTSSEADAMPRARDDAEAKRARALEAKYRPIIKPLSLPGSQPPFTGAVFVNGTGQKIVRVDVRLSKDGDLTLTDNVLEADAPIPMVH